MTDVLMPQMGESIAEGTIVRWIKKVGEKVDRDEPLFEISTDKVDAEIPSPAAGTLADIKVKEGETVPVNSIVAVIASAGEAVAAAPRRAGEEPAGALGAACSLGRASLSGRAARRRPRLQPRRPKGTSGKTKRSRPQARCRPRISATQVVSARTKNCARAQRRHHGAVRHRHQRPCDEDRHPRVRAVTHRGEERAGGTRGSQGGRRRRRRAHRRRSSRSSRAKGRTSSR